MSTIVAFSHPVVKDFQDAAMANFGSRPDVRRRTNSGWVVIGVNGESKPYTLDQLRLLARALWSNLEGQRA